MRMRGPVRMGAAFGALLWVCCLGMAGEALGAEVRAGRVQIEATQEEARVPILLERAAHEEVSGIQFHLLFDAKQLKFVQAEAGAATSAAQKELYANPLSSTEVMCLIAGLNQAAIASGTIAECRFTIPPKLPPGEYALTIANLTLSDPYGIRLPATAGHGGLIRSSPPQADQSVAREEAGSANAPPRPERSSLDRLMYVAAVGLLFLVAALLFILRKRKR